MSFAAARAGLWGGWTGTREPHCGLLACDCGRWALLFLCLGALVQITDLAAVNKAFFLSGSQTDTEIVCVCVQKCMSRISLKWLAPNVSLLDKQPVISKLKECVPTWLPIVPSVLVIARGAHRCSLLCDKDDRNLIEDRGCLHIFSQKYFPHRKWSVGCWLQWSKQRSFWWVGTCQSCNSCGPTIFSLELPLATTYTWSYVHAY